MVLKLPKSKKKKKYLRSMVSERKFVNVKRRNDELKRIRNERNNMISE